MKKFCILICILLCCGCKARYEIKFNDSKIDDKLSITYSKEDDVFRSFAPNPLNAFDNIPYDLKSNSSGNYINLNYTHSFDVEDYSKAYIPSTCFSNYNFIKEDDKYYFFVDGEFFCQHVAYIYFDSLDIVISTNHVVLQENADEKKNGKYIWHVNPNDDSFSLRFVTSSKVANNKSHYVLFGAGLLLLGVFSFFMVKKLQNKNEI